MSSGERPSAAGDAAAAGSTGTGSLPGPSRNRLRLNFDPYFGGPTPGEAVVVGGGGPVVSSSVAAPAAAPPPVFLPPVQPEPPTATAPAPAPLPTPQTMIKSTFPQRPPRPQYAPLPVKTSAKHNSSIAQIDQFRASSGLHSSGKLKISPELTFDFTADDLEDLGEIGRGAYGTVNKMLHKRSSTAIAVKRIRCTVDEREQKKLMMDLEVVMKSNACPFIVKFYGAVFKEGDCWICMELMDASLEQFYKYVFRKMNDRIPENIIGKVALATVLALSYLKEELKIIHRDVKPSNILLDKEGNIKLCDFGISGQLVDSIAQSRDAGCRPYMAPERIDPSSATGYDIRSDVWSLGITLYEVSTGCFPYPKWNSIFEQLSQVVQGEPPRLPPVMNGYSYSEEFVNFVNTCLIKSEIQRPKYARLLKHPFILRSEAEKVDVKSYFTHVFEAMGPSLQQRLENMALLED